MSSLAEIKKSIKSIKDIKHMTRAMQLISTIKTRRAKQQLDVAFPFFSVCAETLAILKSQSNEADSELFSFRKRKPGEEWRVGVVLFSGDQGMAGPYNINLFNEMDKIKKDLSSVIEARGFKPVFYMRILGLAAWERYQNNSEYIIVQEDRYAIDPPTYVRASAFSDWIQDSYFSGEVDEVYLVFTKLRKALSMNILSTRILPVDKSALQSIYEDYSTITLSDVPTNVAMEYGANPANPEKVMSYLVDTYLNAMFYGAMSEAFASEQTSRMTAMKSATENADDMLLQLQKTANMARQSIITNEINEIVSGAEAI